MIVDNNVCVTEKCKLQSHAGCRKGSNEYTWVSQYLPFLCFLLFSVSVGFWQIISKYLTVIKCIKKISMETFLLFLSLGLVLAAQEMFIHGINILNWHLKFWPLCGSDSKAISCQTDKYLTGKWFLHMASCLLQTLIFNHTDNQIWPVYNFHHVCDCDLNWEIFTSLTYGEESDCKFLLGLGLFALLGMH
jgi:hypothetical protein